MAQAHITPDGVVGVAARLYGFRPRVTPLRSNNNQVFLLQFDGTKADRVAKFGRDAPLTWDALRREQHVLRALRPHGISVPEVELTQDDTALRDLWPGPWHIMPRLPGTTLAEFTRTQPHGTAAALWRRAGAFPVQAASVPVNTVPGRWTTARDFAFWDQAWQRLAQEKMLRPPFDQIMQRVRELMERTPVCFAHNDYGATQIITDGHAFGVIDWEGSGEGWEVSSLSRIIAMTREYGGREHGGHEREQIGWLLEGYAEHRQLDDRTRRDLHVWEMWQHVGGMSWKFVCGEDHRRHAFEIAGRVETWFDDVQ